MNGSARMRISQHTVNGDWRPALSEPSKGSPSTRADRSFCFTRRAAAVGSPITSSTLAKQRRGHLCPKVADPRATADEWRDSRSTERSQDVTPLSINRANDGREPLSPSSPQSGHQYSRSLLDCCRRIERQIFAIASRNQLHTDRLAFMQRYRHDDTGRLGAAFFKPFFRLIPVFLCHISPRSSGGNARGTGIPRRDGWAALEAECPRWGQ